MDDSRPGSTAAEGPPPVAYRPGRSPFRAAAQDPLHERVVPVSARIPDYRPNTARRDLIAGLTVAALALPSGMAYAEVAGLSPVNGLYALLLPTVLYTFLGSSRQLIVGPEGSISALVGAALLPLAAAGSSEASELAATLALARRGLLPARLGRAARLAGGLLLAPGAHRLHPRSRGRARLRTARQAARRRHRRRRSRSGRSWRRSRSSARRAGRPSSSAPSRSARSSSPASSCPGSRPRWSSCSRRSSCRGRSTSRPTVSPSSARSRPACRASASRAPPLGDVGRPRAGRDRDLPRQLRRRDPHGEELRGKAEPARPGEPGAARVLRA